MSEQAASITPSEAAHDYLLAHRVAEDGSLECPPDCPAVNGGLRPEAEGDNARIAVPCSRCGLAVTLTVGEYRYAQRIKAPVVHGSGQGCAPAEEKPVLRHFEARVTVVETFDDGRDDDVMTTLTAKADAPTFKAAVDDPLSENLQKRWLKMCETAHFADMSTGDDVPPPA